MGRAVTRTMRPKKHETTEEEGLFRARSSHMKHELVQFAGKLDWDWLDGEIATATGRPGIEVRFVVGLLLLKHIFALSDEEVCESWVYDLYFQYFTGEEFLPTRPSARALRPEPLEETPRREARASAGREPAGRARGRRVADKGPQAGHGRHPVQPKASRFRPTPSCCMPAIQGLNRLARSHGIRPRQSYLRIAKR